MAILKPYKTLDGPDITIVSNTFGEVILRAVFDANKFVDLGFINDETGEFVVEHVVERERKLLEGYIAFDEEGFMQVGSV